MELHPPPSHSSRHDVQFKRVTTPTLWARSHPCFSIYFSLFTSHITLSRSVVVFIILLIRYSLCIALPNFVFPLALSRPFSLHHISSSSISSSSPSVPSNLLAFQPTFIYNFILENAWKTNDSRQLIPRHGHHPRTYAIVT